MAALDADRNGQESEKERPYSVSSSEDETTALLRENRRLMML